MTTAGDGIAMAGGVEAVKLAWSEVLLAAQVALMRQVQNLAAGRENRYGAAPDQNWQIAIEGCCGELAVARYLDLFWSGAVGNLKAADVGPIQVRTRANHKWDLLLHPGDPNDAAFVLVTGRAPDYRLAGWLIGAEGKRKEYWQDPAGGRPAYFVPQAALMPMKALRDAVAGAVDPEGHDG